MMNIIKNLSFNKWQFWSPIFIHSFLILFLTIYTANSLAPDTLPIYLFFSGVFLISTLFSLNTILRFRTGIFYYLLNIIFLLGFWFKYSVQKITSLNYSEPIGTFILSPESEKRVLWVVISGVLGFIISQIFSSFLFNKLKDLKESHEDFSISKKKIIVLLALASLFTFLNLKFNIILFGLKPSLILPFKGNVIYFLALTRGIIFLFFFYCFRNYSNKMVFWGGLIASICSAGVLSRMVILTYFSVVLILILQDMVNWRFKKTLKNILSFIFVFSLFSYLTVLTSTGLRGILYTNQSTPTQGEVLQVQPIGETFGLKEKAKVYKRLALNRWIGIEGVMAVDSYPKKSFSFLWEALKEKSYHGISFYTKVSNPESTQTSETNNLRTTSVPGPIAFFYYSGSLIFVFFAVLMTTLFFSATEQLALKFFYKSRAVGIFISTFMVFDFFQFGISPIAFVRYWSFSFLSIASFYYLVCYKSSERHIWHQS